MIHFMGGETNISTVKKIVKWQCRITITPNGTIFPTDKQIDLLQKFANVKIQLSIDDIGKRFEYQRN